MHTTDCNCGDGDTKRVQDRHIDFHGGAQEMQKFHILLVLGLSCTLVWLALMR